MTQSQSGIQVNYLLPVQSVSNTSSILVLTDFANNTVKLIKRDDFSRSLISSTENNGIIVDDNGLYVQNVGDLNDLSTDDKTSAVAAINETYAKTEENATDIALLETEKVGAEVQTLQNIQALSDGAITIDNTKSIYSLTPSSAVTFSFTIPSETIGTNQALTFELYINFLQTAYSLTFPASVSWQDGETPDLSTAGEYFLVFRTMDGGATWLGNLQGVW